MSPPGARDERFREAPTAGPGDPAHPPDAPEARFGAVHLWSIDLARPAAPLGELRSLLSDVERARADRFHSRRHRRGFAVARSAMRDVLARYLKTEPRDLDFVTGSHGKPRLPSGALRFNLSHSADLALLAITTGRELGVDVEQLRAVEDARSLARRFFAPAESAKLDSVTTVSEMERAFLSCWTRKEAFIKAVGEGLSHPLDTFEVTFLPDEDPGLQVHGSAEPAWLLMDVPTRSGYVAALVVERTAAEEPPPALVQWNWNGIPGGLSPSGRDASEGRAQRPNNSR